MIAQRPAVNPSFQPRWAASSEELDALLVRERKSPARDAYSPVTSVEDP